MNGPLVRQWNQDGKWRDVEDVLRSAAYHRDVNVLMVKCLGYIVCQPAVKQAIKGIVTAGLSKTIIYSSSKVKKMIQSERSWPKYTHLLILSKWLWITIWITPCLLKNSVQWNTIWTEGFSARLGSCPFPFSSKLKIVQKRAEISTSFFFWLIILVE